MILTSKDKSTKMKKIVESFRGNDKFKPVNCLSEIGNVQTPEQFLVKKKLWTTIKEVGTFLSIVIPLLIAVLQFILPYF